MRPPHAAVALVVAVVVGIAAAPLPVAGHLNHVAADAQTSPDGTLVAETAFVASDGHLVVHRDDGGEVGEAIGHVPISADGGLKTDVSVRVDDEAWADWSARHAWLVLHTDDGDGRFEPEDDRILRPFGRIAGERIAVAKGDRALVTAEAFAPQRLDDSDRSVRVRNATLPADGALVVRNASDGRVLDRTTLSAGSHANVSLSVNESFLASNDEFVAEALITDGAGKPVTAGETPVSTTFGVRYRGGAGAATETEAVVRTASRTPAEGGTTGADETATDGGPGDETGVGGPGFGPFAALGALALLTLALGASAPGVRLKRFRHRQGGDDRG